MVGDRVAGEIVLREDVELGLAVGILGEGAIDLEVISPAGEFEAGVSPLGGFFGEDFEGHVGPLACKEGDRSRH